MLSYQHAYHAGNLSDLLKHFALSLMVQYLHQKEKPCFFLDTHAGAGVYDLKSKYGIKTGEIQEGIVALWDKKAQLPSVLASYVEAVRAFNTKDGLRYYPGSFALLQHFLRDQDRLWGCELHQEAYQDLKKSIRRRQIRVEQTDGLQKMIALLPPKERRGLVLIDPSYEVKSEYESIPLAIAAAYQRFATGIYCLWYPMLATDLHEKLLRKLQHLSLPAVAHITLRWQHSILRMQGCGLWIINPPYVLSHELEQGLKAIKQALPHLGLQFEIS